MRRVALQNCTQTCVLFVLNHKLCVGDVSKINRSPHPIGGRRQPLPAPLPEMHKSENDTVTRNLLATAGAFRRRHESTGRYRQFVKPMLCSGTVFVKHNSASEEAVNTVLWRMSRTWISYGVPGICGLLGWTRGCVCHE
jgi:hypothetical protein